MILHTGLISVTGIEGGVGLCAGRLGILGALET
jgi:hypothetical protein